jgi:4-alpha-glucanotransferase
MAFTQYRKLKKYANKKNIRIIGDIPIYVASDSADVWANYKFFQLGKDRRPLLVAGVPPDYFSATGQLWGNPLYDYEKMKKNHFKWWKQRVKKCTKLFDVLRIDHFRGMEAYWAVPGQDKTAMNGHWIKGPGMDLINAIKEGAGSMEIIAEDLGLLTPEVVKLKDQARWPGLVVLEFGFDPNDTQFTSNYLPENYKQECVAYAGTHDNDTLAHFLECQKDLLPTIARYLKITDSPKVADIVKEGQEPQIKVQEIPDLKKMHRRLLQKLMLSKADVVIYLMQDLLFEGGEYRINTPGTSGGNWQYRLAKDYDKNMDLISNLAEEVELARR